MSTLISKAFKAGADFLSKASRNTLSSYVVGVPPQYGQAPEIVSPADVQGLITPERMREIVMKTPTASACLNATLDYCTSVEIKIRNTDPSKPTDPRRAAVVQNYMRRPNYQDTWGQLIYKLMRDISTIGYGALEIERDQRGGVANLWVLDAARLRIDYNEHGKILGFDMLDIRGMPISGEDGVHAWLPQDVIFFPRDPNSYSIYSTSRISQLFTCGVLEDMMIAFISGRFTDSNIPYGLLDLGDITETELENAVDMWNSQSQKQHKIMLTGSKGGSKWYPFAYALKELEAPVLLSEIRGKIMSILGVTMNELGESQDVNKSNGYNLSYTFKKRAIEPVLRLVCDVLTRRLFWEEFGFHDIEAYYDEIDSRDELLQAQIDDMYLKAGVFTFNHLRNRKGLPSVQGGDEPCVFTGSAYIPLRLVAPFAEAQLAAILAVESTTSAGGSGGSGGGNTNISPPLIRPPKMPEGFTTIDGSGSSNVKIKYPQGNSPPQKPRGGIQTLRNVGLRREETG
jgi:hypothetical protein